MNLIIKNLAKVAEFREQALIKTAAEELKLGAVFKEAKPSLPFNEAPPDGGPLFEQSMMGIAKTSAVFVFS